MMKLHRTIASFADQRGNISARLLVANGAVSRVDRRPPRRRGWVSFLLGVLGVLVVVVVALAIATAARGAHGAPLEAPPGQTIGDPWIETNMTTYLPIMIKTVRPGPGGLGAEGPAE